MIYKILFDDEGCMDIIEADNDDAAIIEADKAASDKGLIVFNIAKLDDDYNEIRTIF